MSTAVIISTYNSPEALRKTLLGLTVQTHCNFETIVADDGSGIETELILKKRAFRSLGIRHLWQPDHGWRRPRLLNWAIAECQSDYIIFLDGDTIPRADYVESHIRECRPRTYIAGNRVHIPKEVHPMFADDDILTNRVFDVRELAKFDPQLINQRRRLHTAWPAAMNLLTYRPKVFMGCNASAWRDDLLAVNGFDEAFNYGSDDRDLGARLSNHGCRSRWLKYTLVQLHLDHPFTRNLEQLRRNRARFLESCRTRRTWVEPGIDTAAERIAVEMTAGRRQVA
jgi:glycosyltransferase involved in cell wall biosynthesis